MAPRTFQCSVATPTPNDWPLLIRALTRLVEVPYSYAIRRRNLRFDRQGPVVHMPIPVISVGNITAGGTGKTPMVIAIVEMLANLGRRPAVVARGYKAQPGMPNDEERVIRKAQPGVIYVADPDRCRAARMAHETHGADVVVLDDGFQHRALDRELDLVLIDATCPFGFDHLLPRGLLREPVESLARAGAIVITRCDQVCDADLAGIDHRIRQAAGNKPILRCRHRPVSVESLNGQPLPADAAEALTGKQVALFAGIARPQSFVRTVEQLGAHEAGHRWFPDHHNYTRSDIDELLRELPQADWLLTTEKDAVKLPVDAFVGRRVAVVKVAIDFDEADSTMLRSLVGSVL